jgi:hypothetical protein
MVCPLIGGDPSYDRVDGEDVFTVGVCTNF